MRNTGENGERPSEKGGAINKVNLLLKLDQEFEPSPQGSALSTTLFLLHCVTLTEAVDQLVTICLKLNLPSA